jgi:hypothetical protein
MIPLNGGASSRCDGNRTASGFGAVTRCRRPLCLAAARVWVTVARILGWRSIGPTVSVARRSSRLAGSIDLALLATGDAPPVGSR